MKSAHYNIVLVFLICLYANFCRAEALRFVADEWCPYNCAPGSVKPGFIIEILKLAFEGQECTVVYEILPYQRAIEEVRYGKYEGLVGVIKEEAPDLVYPGRPVLESNNIFYVRTDNRWRFSGIESLSKISLGVIKGYSYAPLLDDYIRSNGGDSRKVQVSTGETALEKNIRKVLSGRLGALVEDRYVLAYKLGKMKLIGSLVEAGGFSGVPIFVAFTPKRKESAGWAALLSREIERLEASGEMDRILERYGVHR